MAVALLRGWPGYTGTAAVLTLARQIIRSTAVFTGAPLALTTGQAHACTHHKTAFLLSLACATGFAASAASAAKPARSKGGQAFVAKVSQGSLFEVEASKVGEKGAQAQDVKDLAKTEVPDHRPVGAKLKSIASCPEIVIRLAPALTTPAATVPTPGCDTSVTEISAVGLTSFRS